MSSCDLIFKLEQDTDKLKMVIFWIFFRVMIRPSDLQKLTKLLKITWSDGDSEIELKYYHFQLVCVLF